MKLIIILSLYFCASTHPIAMIITLILSTLTMAFFWNFILKKSWISIIFTLLILGGMLILFIYVASLASNEPFKMTKMLYLAPFILISNTKPMPCYLNFKDNLMNSFYSSYSGLNTFLAVMYLLLVLLVMIDIISCLKSPLRSK